MRAVTVIGKWRNLVTGEWQGLGFSLSGGVGLLAVESGLRDLASVVSVVAVIRG